MKVASRLTVFNVLLVFSFSAHATSLEGIVLDRNTGQPLEGANVLVETQERGAVTDTAGYFIIQNLSEGDRVLISASYVGYRVEKKRISLEQRLNNVRFTLQPILLSVEEVVYTADRAREDETPASFTNLTGEEIRQQYYAQDIPPMLEMLPSVYSYSESGNDIGYSYMKVRGFDQKRLGVTVNGIPLNDPEDGTVYWVDTPDLAANLQDIQLQRGVSYSASGSGGFGGAINLVTLTPGFEEARTTVNTGAGSFGTRKWGLSYNSGIIKNTYGFYGRFSQIRSDGYRDNSDVNLYSYFLSAIRYGERSQLTLNVYGGREVTHAAWDAAPESALRTNRRHNPISYDNTIDDFSQPRYELHHRFSINDNMLMENTFFYVRGDGYYEQYKDDRDLVDFGYHYFDDPAGTTILESDVVNQKVVEKDHVGWLPRFEWVHSNSVTQIGGDLQHYEGRHYGHVIWGQNLPQDAEPRTRYYRYDGNILFGGAYVKHTRHLDDRLTIEGQIEARTQFYAFDQLPAGNFRGAELNTFDADYLFLNPKVGLHYEVTRDLNLYTSLGMSHRSPTNDEYWDQWTGPDDLGVDPLFATVDTVLNSDGSVKRLDWTDPTIDPEQVLDLELGTRWTKGNLFINLNGYWMSFRNEIVPAGGVRDGSPVTDNADQSVHMGIELNSGYRPAHGLQGWLNLSLSDDRLVDYTTYDWAEDWSTIEVDLSDNKIALFPSFMSNLGIGYVMKSWSIFVDHRFVGRQYLDNTENDERSIDSFSLVGVSAQYKLPVAIGIEEWVLSAHVNNLLDEEYETAGWYDAWAGENFYYVGATRNWFLGLSARF
ncbi:TonB-dependent receptor [bacterium]|nr:TonB-dependent receptor [bacterium]